MIKSLNWQDYQRSSAVYQNEWDSASLVGKVDKFDDEARGLPV